MSTKVKLSSLRADTKKETDGDWIDSSLIPGAAFKVRSINYPPYTIARDLMQQRLRRKANGKPVAQDVLYSELGRLYAEHILLDWSGFLDDSDHELEYSSDIALETLTDPGFREMVLAVEIAAGQVGQAEIEFVDDLAKNSPAPSAIS